MIKGLFLAIMGFLLISFVIADMPVQGFEQTVFVSSDGAVYSGPSFMNNPSNNQGISPNFNQGAAQPGQIQAGGQVYSQPFYPQNPPSSQNEPGQNQGIQPGYSGPSYQDNPQQQQPQDMVQPINEPVNQPIYTGPSYQGNPQQQQPQDMVQPINEPVNQPIYSGPSYQDNPQQQQPQDMVQPINEPVNQPIYSGPFYQDNPQQQQPQAPVNQPVYSEPYYPQNPPQPQPSQAPVQPIQKPVNPPVYSGPSYPQNPPPYYSDTDSDPIFYTPYSYYKNPAFRDNPNYRWDYSSCNDHDYCYSGYYYWKDKECGILEVSSTPVKAEVFLDDTFRGYTKTSGYLTLYNIRTGTHTLHLKYSGYYDYYEDLVINRYRVTTAICNMVRIGNENSDTGSLTVQSDPKPADIYLDNLYKGITPLTLKEVLAGEHTILIRRTGYSDYITKVQIVKGQTMSISAILSAEMPSPTPAPIQTQSTTPVPTPTKAGIPGWIMILSLAIGIIFLSKPGKKI